MFYWEKVGQFDVFGKLSCRRATAWCDVQTVQAGQKKYGDSPDP